MLDNTPLIAIEAVVLDTETTGLDPNRARIVQIGAVHLTRGVPGETFVQPVNPGVPIPPETTRIHGFTAASLADAPSYADIHAGLVSFCGARVLIGHNIGFDLAVLQREASLAGQSMAWTHVLDTRLLGEICFPRLSGFSLDSFASHLGIDIAGRHDALADADVTARIFLALLPALRAKQIRTLIEAETACRRLTEALEQYNRAGWVEPLRPRAMPDSVLSRIDAFPFRHRVQDIASQPPVWVAPMATLRDAVTLMAERRISSVFVSAAADSLQEPIGIITERDVIHHLGTTGEPALDATAGSLASRPLETVPAEAFLYRAIGRMERLRIRHLGVVDEAGEMIGAVSARDLLRLRSSDALALGDAIDQCMAVGDLAAAWGRLPQVVRRLRGEAVSSREIAAIISREIGALTRRAAMEAEAAMIEAGLGAPPAPYAVLVLGSGGRGESLLVPDQDNAVVHGGDEDATAWFLKHGQRMNATLDAIGIPLCKGGIMAGKPDWNGSLAAWQHRVRGWTETVDPEDLLAVDIFFDGRPVAGSPELANQLRRHALASAEAARPMIKLLADQIRNWSPPLGFLGRFQTNDAGRIDLKRGGLFPVVALARCLALSHGIPARGTAERLRLLQERGVGAAPDLAMLTRLLEMLLDTLLDQQLADIAQGIPPGTGVEVRRLDKAAQARLREGLGELRIVPTLAHDLLFS